MRSKAFLIVGVVAVGLWVAAELMVRAVGATNFPLYVRDSIDGYRPAPNQHGALFRRNDWVYNNLGMGVAGSFRPVGSLIVGDSETEGSVSFMKQADKIGPLLTKDTGQKVWPMGAKGWGLANELAWVNSHPEVFTLHRIMILSNSGDFGPAHPWDDEILHPTHRPMLELPYLLEKKFYKGDPVADDPPETTASTAIWHAALHRFLANYHGQVVFILLPIQSEVASRRDGFAPLTDELKSEGRSNLYVIRVADDSAWRHSLYQNEYHPNPEGNRELAAFVSRQLPPLK